MPIPESIKSKRPTQFGAVEIRLIKGYFYVYLVSSKWDSSKGRPQKVTGKSIGKITEADGFIPNANGMRIMQAKAAASAVPAKVQTDSDKGADKGTDTEKAEDSAPVVKNYGAYETLRGLSPEIDTLLKKHFPDSFREIRTIALLRLVDGISSVKMIQPMFLDSYMSDLCSDLPVSEGPVRRFIAKLGTMQDTIDSLMREQVIPGSTLLFDGTSIFIRSDDSLSMKGYNPDHSLNPQARILYVFEKDSHRPVFYRVLQGSIVDKAAFLETVRAAGCQDCIIIADKGFYSKKNVSALMLAGMKYILPLQDNTTNVPKEFYANNDDSKWDGVFTYKKRPVWYWKHSIGDKGDFIYTYRDDIRKAEMVGGFVESAEKDCGEEEHKTTDVLKETRMGYFSFCSNLDVGAKEIYLDYKERWDIEECFDYLKNSVATSPSHAHTDEYFRGWAFVNHISLLYYYGLLNALRLAGLDEKYSAGDIIKLTKNIYLVDTGDGKGPILSKIRYKTKSVLTKLGVDLLRKN